MLFLTCRVLDGEQRTRFGVGLGMVMDEDFPGARMLEQSESGFLFLKLLSSTREGAFPFRLLSDSIRASIASNL